MAQGMETEVVCIEATDRGSTNEINAVHDMYEGIPVWRLSFDLMHVTEPMHSHWFYDCPLLGQWFGDYFRKTQPDLVHFQAGYLLGVAPLKAAHANGIPTVLTLHDYWFLCPRHTLLRADGILCNEVPQDPAVCAWCVRQNARSFRVLNWLPKDIAMHAIAALPGRHGVKVIANRRETLLPALALPNVVIAPSQFLATYFEPYVPQGHLEVSPYGLELGASPTHEQVRLSDGPVRIAYIGQIAHHKGVHVLVSAFRSMPLLDQLVELDIYGGLEANPGYVSELQKIASGDDRIHFHGRLSNAQIREVLRHVDATVVPSVWFENAPFAITEARAAGVPVLTSALGGMAELVKDEIDGLHFRAGDSVDLQRQIMRLINEPGLLSRLRSGAAGNPPRSIDSEVEYLLGIYQRVAANMPARA